MDDFAGRVMGIERGGAGGAKFILGKQIGKFQILGLPVG